MAINGHVSKKWQADGDSLVEVTIEGANSLGKHMTGTVVVAVA
jgi:hypothetical protein